MPPRLLGFLDKTFSVIHHPATSPDATSLLAEDYLGPFLSRNAAHLLEHYEAVTSRGGLVLLQRREINWRQSSERASDLCVYDPMTGDRAFLPLPPGIGRDNHYDLYLRTFVLLTEADGISCSSFRLLAVDLDGLQHHSSRHIRVHAVSADGKWSPPATTHAVNPSLPLGGSLVSDAAIVLGGVVHFLLARYVLTYDPGTTAMGTIELPTDCDIESIHLRIGSTPDGSLRLFGGPVHDGSRLSFWLLSGDSWSQRVDIDTLTTLQQWEQEMEEQGDGDVDDRVEVVGIGDHRSSVVLLQLRNLHFVLDTEAAEIRRIGRDYKLQGIPYTIDLPSRLSAMKVF